MESFHSRLLMVIFRLSGKRLLEIGPAFGWKEDLIWCVFEIFKRLINTIEVTVCP